MTSIPTVNMVGPAGKIVVNYNQVDEYRTRGYTPEEEGGAPATPPTSTEAERQAAADAAKAEADAAAAKAKAEADAAAAAGLVGTGTGRRNGSRG